MRPLVFLCDHQSNTPLGKAAAALNPPAGPHSFNSQVLKVQTSGRVESASRRVKLGDEERCKSEKKKKWR